VCKSHQQNIFAKYVSLISCIFHKFHTLWADKKIGESAKQAGVQGPRRSHSEEIDAPVTSFLLFFKMPVVAH